ncbi:MAG: hypothetical protein ACI8W8_001613 [Rhodothermales bacterium]|jgi:hypothetical protein
MRNDRPRLLSVRRIGNAEAHIRLPPASQTSPTSTSTRATFSPPDATRNSRDSALARMGSSLTNHLPAVSAIADLVWSAKVTVTAFPGLAQPQIGTGISRCNTAWSVKIFAKRRSSARAAKQIAKRLKQNRWRFIAGRYHHLLSQSRKALPQSVPDSTFPLRVSAWRPISSSRRALLATSSFARRGVRSYGREGEQEKIGRSRFIVATL